MHVKSQWGIMGAMVHWIYTFKCSKNKEESVALEIKLLGIKLCLKSS